MKQSTWMSGLALVAVAFGSAMPMEASDQQVAQMLGLRPESMKAFAQKSVVANSGSVLPGANTIARTAAQNPFNFIGSVVFPDNVNGTWKYSTDAWNPQRLAMNVIASGGGFAVGNYYYVNRIETVMGITAIATTSYDMSDNWSIYDNYSTDKLSYVATTMAYSAERDQVYGCFLNDEGTGYTFTRWNYDYYRPDRVIAQLERPWSGCTFNRSGVLYAIERNGDLYTVNLKNGDMSLVGNTGHVSTYQTDCTWDDVTGRIIWCVNTDTEFALYSVDPATASATKLYDLQNGEQICGMAPMPAAVVSEAPAKVSSISISGFSGGAMTGKVSFSIPTRTVGGVALPTDTDLIWTLKANGEVIATGQAKPNARINQDVVMTESDSYNFEATVTNEAGTSPVCTSRKFVGVDTPKALTTFSASVKGMTVTLNWGSVSSTGVDGGSVPTSQATYTVVRYPDMKVIADAVTTRTATDVIEMPETRTDYYYEVKVAVGDKVSEPKRSASITFGPIVPPFTTDFAASTKQAGWEIVDADANGTTFVYYAMDGAMRFSGKTADDWFISPEVIVKEGFTYPVTVKVKTSNNAEEKFEVKAGAGITAQDMTMQIVEPTSFKSTTETTYSGDMTAAADGRLRIGIHAMTEGTGNAFYITGIEIGQGINSKAPAAVADLNVTSPVDGTPRADLTFKAPELTLGGAQLTGQNALTKIEIERDGNLVKTISTDLTPGAEISVSDTENVALGTHKYKVTAYNSFGAGTAAEQEVLVGARRPVAPASAKMVEDGNTGKVTISWPAVTTDVEGNTIRPDAVKYRVIDRQYNTIAENLDATSFTYQAVPEGEQAFVQFAVYAITAGGESEKMAATAYKAVGAPSTAPWTESFADKTVHSPFGFNYIKGNEPWQMVNTCDWGITPQDDDNGYAYFEAYAVYTALVTGKIDLGEIESPALSYYAFNGGSQASYTNSIDIQVDNGDGQGFRSVQENIVSDAGPKGQWNKIIVDLSEYAAQTIAIRIEPKNADLAYYAIDNLRIASHVERNLTAMRLTGPQVADAEQEIELQFTYSNTGEFPMNNYTVELWKGDEIVAEKSGPAIQPGETKSVNFAQTLHAIDADEVEFRAVINSRQDMIERDNTSEPLVISVATPAVPAPTDLNGSKEGEAIKLTWTAPDMDNVASEPVTETFENAESWTQAVDGWKFIDVDQAPVGGIQINKFPITGNCSWFVADYMWESFQAMADATRWAAHSGNKFIASSYVMRAGKTVQSDDWAISPRLFGGAQTISFYAKSFDPQYLEDFEVLYSSDTSNIDDFQSVGSVVSVPNAWTKYRYQLPEGAKYFAIRSRSADKFFLFIDDATYIPANGQAQQLQLAGYNVYRDGVKLNDQPLTDTSFTDNTADLTQNHSYLVTAVYDKGESRPTNKYTYDILSAVGEINAAGDIRIAAGAGAITVVGVDGGDITVAAVSGQVVARIKGNGNNTIRVAPGIYIVNAAGKKAKLIVK